MATIKERIKELRKKYGYTQESLAETLGLSAKSSIANYESGANAPSDEIKLKMCNLFHCSMDYLMGITSFTNPKEDLEKELSNLNLSENDFNNLISIIKENKYTQYLFYKGTNKLFQACKLCALLSYDYTVPYTEELTQNQEKELNILQNQYRKTEQSILLSLDKNKIIHNYNEEKKQLYMTPVYGRISAGQPNWAEECIEGRLPIDPSLMGIIDPEECYFLRINGESMNKVVSNGSYALIRKTDWVENGEIAVVLVNGYDATLKKFSKQGDLIVLEPMSNDNSFQVQIYDKNTHIEVIGKYIGKFEMKQ